MLLIRNEQMAAIVEAARERFKGQVIEHLRRHFPLLCEAMGEREVRATVDEGFLRAAGHGIRLERDVCRFVDLMFFYGKRFDTEIAWAATILRSPDLTDPTARLDVICDLARRNESASG